MCISENTLNVIITSIVSIISLLLGFLLSRYQFKKEKQLQTAQQKFAMFYRPFVEMCRVTYYIDIDPDAPFTSLDDSERFKILSHLRKYDYLATEAWQFVTNTARTLSTAEYCKDTILRLLSSMQQDHDAWKEALWNDLMTQESKVKKVTVTTDSLPEY